MGKGVQIAVATATVFAAVVWLLNSGSQGEGTFQYYASVDAYVGAAKLEAGPGRNAARGDRVHGFVVLGSIQPDLEAGHVDFLIHDDPADRTLPVRYSGIDLPDLFADGAEVVVEGRPIEGRFVADRVMAKCPSKYEAEDAAGEVAKPGDEVARPDGEEA